MGERGRQLALTVTAALSVLALLVPLIPMASAAITTADVTKMASMPGTFNKILQRATLSAGTSNLSAAADNIFEANYKADGTDLIPCTGHKLYYTTDGSNPAKGAAGTTALDLVSGVSPCVAPAAQVTIKGTITKDKFNNVPPGSSVKFVVEVAKADGTPGLCDPVAAGACPGAPGATSFFAYVIDKSAPKIAASGRTPAREPASSFPDAVTSNNRTAISFLVTDSPLETPLRHIPPRTINVEIDEENETANFTRTGSLPLFSATLDFDYSKKAATFGWADGEHTIDVKASDFAENPISTTTADKQIKFWIDRTNPVLSELSATPAQSATVNGVVTTGFGVNVTVKAKVTDNVGMNTNATADVTATLFNDTKALTSDAAPLRFNATSSLWEGSVVVPEAWRAQGTFRVRLEVTASDIADNTASSQTGGLFQLDPTVPLLTVTPLPGFLSQGPYEVRARVSDTVSGVDNSSVKLRIVNQTGQFNSTTGWTRISNNTFEKSMDQPNPGNFSGQIPDATHNAVVLYNVTVRDRAGNTARSTPGTLRVDKVGPTLTEFTPPAFRGPPPHVFVYAALDAESGVNVASGNLSYRVQGTPTYAKVPLGAGTVANTLLANITSNFDHGVTVEYFAEVRDRAGNLGTNGTAAAPRTYRVDRNAPTASLTAPASHTGTSQFSVLATATDDLSGVRSITLQARPRPEGGASTLWITVGTVQTATGAASASFSLCLVGGVTYEFRVFATDAAGNKGTPPATAQATTSVEGAGCPQTLSARITFPTGGATLDAEGGEAIVAILYEVTATGSLTSPDLIRIDLEFSPDGGTFFGALVRDAPNTGQYNWTLHAPACTDCRLRLGASAAGLTNVTATSLSFKITNGDSRVDLDGNGLADDCELKPGNFPPPARLGVAEPKEDLDDDDLTNAKECELGTNPNNPDTDSDGFSDGVEVRAKRDPLDATDVPTKEETRFLDFNATWWLVVALFLAVSVVFLLGLAWRW